MNPLNEGQVGQGSRIVTAGARLAMAREKARITEKRARQPSALEEAAAEWEKEREAKLKKVEEERLGSSRQVEACPLSFQQVSLQSNGIGPTEDDVGWRLFNPRPEKADQKRRAATIVTGRVNTAGICVLAVRVKAMERARALGRKPVDLRAYALEQAARRWAQKREPGGSHDRLGEVSTWQRN